MEDEFSTPFVSKDGVRAVTSSNLSSGILEEGEIKLVQNHNAVGSDHDPPHHQFRSSFCCYLECAFC